MKALDHLRSFILAKDTNEERHEIREYMHATAAELAPEFGTTEEILHKSIDAVGDDEQLGKRVLARIKSTKADNRDLKRNARTCAAQEAADTFCQTIRWEYGAARLDVPGLLDLLVFRTAVFTANTEAGAERKAAAWIATERDAADFYDGYDKKCYPQWLTAVGPVGQALKDQPRVFS